MTGKDTAHVVNYTPVCMCVCVCVCGARRLSTGAARVGNEIQLMERCNRLVEKNQSQRQENSRSSTQTISNR